MNINYLMYRISLSTEHGQWRYTFKITNSCIYEYTLKHINKILLEKVSQILIQISNVLPHSTRPQNRNYTKPFRPHTLGYFSQTTHIYTEEYGETSQGRHHHVKRLTIRCKREQQAGMLYLVVLVALCFETVRPNYKFCGCPEHVPVIFINMADRTSSHKGAVSVPWTDIRPTTDIHNS